MDTCDYISFIKIFNKFDKSSLIEYLTDNEIIDKEKINEDKIEKIIRYYNENIKLIKYNYNNNIVELFEGNSCIKIINRLFQLNGVGQKIATMTVNILHRKLNKEFNDLHFIDISIDTHVREVMQCLFKNEIKKIVNNERAYDLQILYKAREMYPEYPGYLDYYLWCIGKNHCHKNTTKDCDNCILKSECKYYLITQNL